MAAQPTPPVHCASGAGDAYAHNNNSVGVAPVPPNTVSSDTVNEGGMAVSCDRNAGWVGGAEYAQHLLGHGSGSSSMADSWQLVSNTACLFHMVAEAKVLKFSTPLLCRADSERQILAGCVLVV